MSDSKTKTIESLDRMETMTGPVATAAVGTVIAVSFACALIAAIVVGLAAALALSVVAFPVAIAGLAWHVLSGGQDRAISSETEECMRSEITEDDQ